MNIPLLVTILLALLFISVDAWKARKRKKQTNEALSELTKALLKKDFATYESLIEKNENLGLFPRFNASYMRLEGAIAKDDERRASKILREMNVSSLVERQRAAAANLAFSYYMNRDDYPTAKTWLEVIEALKGSDALKTRSAWLYDAYAEHRDAHLDEVLAAMEKATGPERGYYENIAAQIYRNRGEAEKAEGYDRAAREHLQQR